jgi:hypothetical protein
MASPWQQNCIRTLTASERGLPQKTFNLEFAMNFDGTWTLPNRETNLPSMPDNRPSQAIDERLEIGARLQIRWEERKGVQREIYVRALEVTKSMLRVQSERKIASGTLVVLYTADFVPIGRASVRDCAPRGMDYDIALYVPSCLPDL